MTQEFRNNTMIFVPLWFLGGVAFLCGVTIGSFLNAVIYRLPKGLSLLEPRFSICPHCRHRLGALDLIPLFSFLILRCRCRYCGKPIAWRYFGVELLTGVLFTLVVLRFMEEGALICLALLAYTAVLIPVFFIDLATFTIPDTLNILLFCIPIGLELVEWGRHATIHPFVGGWLPVSIWGAVIGTLLFGSIRILGWLWKGVEAMGLGDVLLGRGMGAMLALQVTHSENPLRLLPVWVVLSCLAGLIVGPVLIYLRRHRSSNHQEELALAEGEQDGEHVSPAGYLLHEVWAIVWCLILGDLWAYLGDLWKRWRGEKVVQENPAAEDWVPAPTAIPFGPFLVIGFFLTLFWGNALVNAYLAYAFSR
ncbi:prepilin peptidase [Chthonomonas calidirosea]|uniref:prepilin peptidase n=1 Tax=Chthonomonas calidirosea TaxID=454171 RepID=UPI0009489F83|nr:A24 family peptidase [Chthonomonas calidirosea]